jgi:hypothetical protein
MRFFRQWGRCVWMSTGNVREEGVLSWTGRLLGRLLSGVSQEMMGPFIDSPVDPPPIQANTNKIQVQVTTYAQWRTLCCVKSLRFVHTSCWFSCKSISCKLSLSIAFYWRYFTLIFQEKIFLTSTYIYIAYFFVISAFCMQTCQFIHGDWVKNKICFRYEAQLYRQQTSF